MSRKRNNRKKQLPNLQEQVGTLNTASGKMSRRKNFWLNRLLDVILFALVFWGVTSWQARNLLDSKEVAPDFQLTSLRGEQVQLYDNSNKKTVVYFFAPWCKVCALSSLTINALERKKDRIQYRILAVALDYENPDEVKEFAQKHKLSVPVLLGTPEVQGKYLIDSFPTFYVLDKNNKIKTKTVGYTSAIGLQLRSL